jgi:hypothetical protein
MHACATRLDRTQAANSDNGLPLKHAVDLANKEVRITHLFTSKISSEQYVKSDVEPC